MKGSQLGASESGCNWIGYVIHHAPGPMLAVQPTVELAKRFSQQRIDPLIEESPVLRAVKPEDGSSPGTGSSPWTGGPERAAAWAALSANGQPALVARLCLLRTERRPPVPGFCACSTTSVGSVSR